MKRKSVYILGLFVLFSSMLYAGVTPVMGKASDGVGAAQTYEVVMLWNSSMTVYDVAVSKDGNYIAAVNNTGIHYFASTNSTPKWWYSPQSTFMSVAISADGEYVVAGDNNGYIHYFNDSTAITGERLSSTWNSTYLGGSVERGTLDMSDDGEYVVVGGTGISLYYFAGCRERSGSDETPTWSNVFGVNDFRAVHISSDGKYVAAGGTDYPGGFVVFYKDANATPYPTEPNWYATSSINGSIIDLAVSDDGYAVAAVDITYMTLYYWANATTLSGDPNATWTNNGNFWSVDMSADGDNVVAGAMSIVGSLHFWADARDRQGNQTESWVELEFENVYDAAIIDDGGIIAASAYNGTSYKAYFFESNSNMIGEFDLLQHSPMVSMSGNGNVTAVAGPGYDSLYVFIPEFPLILVMPLFMMATLLAVLVHRIRMSRKTK